MEKKEKKVGDLDLISLQSANHLLTVMTPSNDSEHHNNT